MKTKIILIASLLFVACKNNTKTSTTINTKELTTISENPTKEQEMSALSKPYHPEENAEKAIDSLIKIAKVERKNIMIQAGGNWCIWCLRFNKYRLEQTEIKQIIDKNYLYYHLNFSKENENKVLFEKYGDPGKLGYPVFIVLDENGKQIHTQESGSLEDGKNGYDLAKVKSFFEAWVPK